MTYYQRYLRERRMALVIGPCGAGKSTYAQSQYPSYLLLDREPLQRACDAHHQLAYGPPMRTLGKVLQQAAMREACQRGYAWCVLGGGATRAERATIVQVARTANYQITVIRLLVSYETALERARTDKNRPTSSRNKWQAIITNWFARFEPVDLGAEGIDIYHEVNW